ncbi:MAG: alkaline phosphatase [Candidatus Moranbacteria bacterium RIFOXYA12_FULL_44_15]|nr:MAG: alkaline phosphatase [Candidatus Moranbacteria bacterium RIFOXYA12_FULL_44_15]OGI34282.1 MAG: alkaline phosphatase [Candidatus Moranbacteria bacterium RIFOXYA2_FULL_43_15]
MVEKIISILASFIIASISMFGYSGVALMMAIESACIPLPSEIIMPFSGYLVSTGEFTLWGVALAGAIGCVIGSVAAYWVGYYGGRPMAEKYGKYVLVTHHDLDIADNFFAKYGNAAVFFSRMMPVVRTFISLPAGIARMNFWQFVVYTFLGSLPFCYLLAYIGKKLGDNWNTLGVYFHKFDIVIGIVILAGLVWFVRRHLSIKKSKFQNPNPK